MQDLSAHELKLVIDGRARRERELRRLVLGAAALIANAFTGGDLTAERLMGEEMPDDDFGHYDVSRELEEAAARRDAQEEADARGWVDELGLDEVVQ